MKENDGDILLARLDERTEFISQGIIEIKATFGKAIERLEARIDGIGKEVDILRQEVSDFRGKWSVIVIGMGAGISILVFIVEKILAPLFGIK